MVELVVELSAYVAAFIAFDLAATLDSRTALLSGLVVAGGLSFWYVAAFLRDFPRRSLLTLFAGGAGLFILGGAVPLVLRDYSPTAAASDALYNAWSNFSVAPMALASAGNWACVLAVALSARIPLVSSWTTLSFRYEGDSRTAETIALILGFAVAAAAVGMVATGVASISASPYADPGGADASKAALGPLYLTVFGILPAVPSLMSQVIAASERPLAIRGAGVLIAVTTLVIVLLLGRRYFFVSALAALVLGLYRRGGSIPFKASLTGLALLVPVFIVLSTHFQAVREEQSSSRTVSVGEMASTGQLEKTESTSATSEHAASRLAILGESASLFSRLPVFGAAHGLTVVSALLLDVPSTVWPEKHAYMDGPEVWTDSKIELAAGNAGFDRFGGRDVPADIGSTLFVYSWADFGVLAPIWSAAQAIAFFALLNLLTRIPRSAAFSSIAASQAIAFALVADATAPAVYTSVLRDLTQDALIVAALAWALRLTRTKPGQRRTSAGRRSPAGNARKASAAWRAERSPRPVRTHGAPSE